MFPHSLTIKKQSGKSLTHSEIELVVNGYSSGKIPDEEMAAWLKAVFDNGMDHEETLHYTRTMLQSGVQLDFSHLPGFIVDKHSTGGVGDKISIVLAPLLAACGCYIPMLAGRGLGHTQGTIDKLETIPGYRSELSLSKFQHIVEDIGISIMAQTEQICPADRKIYALRDVTNTIASFPLICGSIMSKKIAEGIQGLVLDIKVGNGAFMKTMNEAHNLGSLLKEVGKLYGLHVSISFTDMNQPLGKTAGLWCEVMESIECLKDNGPDDVMKVVYHLGKKALKLAEVQNPEEKLKTAISDGSALNKFRVMIKAHDGLLESLDDPNTHKPKYCKKVYAEMDGYISSIDTLRLGMTIVHLGGGRLKRSDILDPTVGIKFYKKIGDAVNMGDVLLEYFYSDKEKLNSDKLCLKETIQIQSKQPDLLELIYR